MANETQHHRTEHSTKTVKKPNWPEANQLAIYKYGREMNHGLPGTIQGVARTSLEPGNSESQDKRPNLPPWRTTLEIILPTTHDGACSNSFVPHSYLSYMSPVKVGNNVSC